jgi:serine protease
MMRIAPLLAVVAAAALALAVARPAHAEPTAHFDAYVPNDPGVARQSGHWSDLQWNFSGSFGVDAPGAWGNLIGLGVPGGAGVTGVAYANRNGLRRSPDLDAAHVVPGWDFVSGDRYPLDLNGHGTHVASTIAEQTDNAVGVTGLAYGVNLMPVRVLVRYGAGSASTIAKGVRFAVDHGAKVINMSLSFSGLVTAEQIRPLLDALDYARENGRLVVSSAGNFRSAELPYPARAETVLAVGATTEWGCLAAYSDYGAGLDLVAPGGGNDAAFEDDPACRPGRPGRAVYQVTFRPPSYTLFGIRGFAGTSMAAPHVSAAAALVVASGVLGVDPSPDAITQQLTQTARDLGAPGYDVRYGSGLLNAAVATAPPAASS